MEADIAIIDLNIEALARDFPELAPHAAFCLKAVNTSLERSRLPAKGLSNAARHSIACYIMTLVASAWELASRTGADIGPHASALFKHALSIEQTPPERHARQKSFNAPDGWEGPAGGPWTRDQRNIRFSLVNSPKLPGGDWVVLMNGLPCLYGKDPDDVIERSEAMVDHMDRQVAKSLVARFAPRPFGP
jgi:hypothetical protein